ncbi:hypothetical protein PG996_013089 [Apiospora saccharicola]|uniref:Transmembrane protein n=1 Tax=Apiospora saccharicola TaxID=335842 RepID=A0ABR1U4F8_9PEZI
MYRSSFSYNVTRPYPFKWFTPVAVIGGIIITVLVSFFNFASNGYELVATSSNDPNATVSDPSQHGGIQWPSYFVGNTRATCAPATLPLNTLIYTQSSAIGYTLRNVWRIKDDGTQANLGSLVYHNNMLQNCNVTEVSIDITGNGTQSAKDTAVSHAGLLINALASCSVNIDTLQTKLAQGPTYFELRGSYKLVNPEVKTFLSRDATKSTSLYWGESMLHMYWMLVAKAYIDSVAEWHEDATYNAVMTDLGRNKSNVPNMLTHPNLLANLTANLTKEVEWWEAIQTANEPPQSIDPGVHLTPDSGLALKSFDPTQTSQSNLGATPAFLSSNYICQVPRTKSPGALFFSILVADLVILQSVWVAFRFVVDTVSQRKDPALRYCAGCTTNTREEDNYTEGMELMGSRGRRSNSATEFAPLPSPSGSPHQPLIK